MTSLNRRQLLKALGGAALSLPLAALLGEPRLARADGVGAKRLIVFYFPDGVPGPSQSGDPSLWHATGSELGFQLPDLLQPLNPFRDRCVFFNGLTMGPTDEGSHPGGARKLLTGVDGGNGESIDQHLARTVGALMPHRHLYLGAMANHNNASGDKFISYPAPGSPVAPEDSPIRAFERLFGSGVPSGGGDEPPDPRKALRVSVIDGALGEMNALRSRLGGVEQRKLDQHLESLREVERRIKDDAAENPQPAPASCAAPSLSGPAPPASELYEPGRFPALLKLQIDLMVQAMACNLTRVGVLQASHHTSELIMSRFEGSALYDPGFDMRSHQASHYGSEHDASRREFASYVQQRRWFVEQFAYLLDQLRQHPDGDGNLLDSSLVVLCTEVCDGNTHLHSNMPFIVAGGAGGRLRTGRLLNLGERRHSDLLLSIGHAMGADLGGFGEWSNGGVPGLLS